MNLNKVIEILKTFKPLSIFLYGSQANNSTNKKSDYEIGVIFNEEDYVSRSTIKKEVPWKKFSIFPFNKAELLNYSIDTPFQKKIYIASLICGNAYTLYGDKIIENLEVPEITIHDLLMDTSFNLGYALSSVRLMKSGHINLANEFLYKSMFYATRNLIYLKNGKLISGYNNIYLESKYLNLPNEYNDLLEIGFKLRNGNLKKINISLYFKNISYINRFIIPTLEEST